MEIPTTRYRPHSQPWCTANDRSHILRKASAGSGSTHTARTNRPEGRNPEDRTRAEECTTRTRSGDRRSAVRPERSGVGVRGVWTAGGVEYGGSHRPGPDARFRSEVRGSAVGSGRSADGPECAIPRCEGADWAGSGVPGWRSARPGRGARLRSGGPPACERAQVRGRGVGKGGVREHGRQGAAVQAPAGQGGPLQTKTSCSAQSDSEIAQPA